MLRILQRYLAASFLPPFIISLTFFVVFLVTFQLFRIIRFIASKSVEVQTVLELMLHISVSFTPVAVPLALILAMIYTLNKLSEDSEIIAMRSFGVSKFKLFFPFLMIGIFIAIAIFSLNRNIVPRSNGEFRKGIIRLGSASMLRDIRSEKFFTQIPSIILFAEKVSNKGKELKNVFILSKNKNNSEGTERIIFASSGELIKQKPKELEFPVVKFHLKNGNIINLSRQKGKESDVEKIFFKEYNFPARPNRLSIHYVTKDGMRTTAELLDKMYKQKLKLRPGEFNRGLVKSELELWTRHNTPLQCIVFILLGFVFGVKKGRGSSRNVSSWALLTITLYYVLLFAGIAFARKGLIPSYVAVFLPTLLATILGIRSYRNLDWIN
ncbi:MAG: LptF/LptG family permease [Bacteriovoracaceae bacterium]|nr:LptF/LptG family permease [Bacteriovoracaceae bacterium]